MAREASPRRTKKYPASNSGGGSDSDSQDRMRKVEEVTGEERGNSSSEGDAGGRRRGSGARENDLFFPQRESFCRSRETSFICAGMDSRDTSCREIGTTWLGGLTTLEIPTSSHPGFSLVSTRPTPTGNQSVSWPTKQPTARRSHRSQRSGSSAPRPATSRRAIQAQNHGSDRAAPSRTAAAAWALVAEGRGG